MLVRSTVDIALGPKVAIRVWRWDLGERFGGLGEIWQGNGGARFVDEVG